jgi:hypothetical protein
MILKIDEMAWPCTRQRRCDRRLNSLAQHTCNLDRLNPKVNHAN